MDEQWKNDGAENTPKEQPELSQNNVQIAYSNSDKKDNKSKAFYQKWWFWLIIALVVLAAIGSVAGGASTEEEEEEPKTEIKYYVGDTVSSGDLYVTVNDIRETNYVNGVTTDNLYIILDVTIENRGNKSATYKQDCFILKNGDRTYEICNDGIYLPDGYWLQIEVGAGLKRNTALVYEIPRSYVYDNYYLEVKEGWLSSSAKVYLIKPTSAE